ncbi:hypothetical protein Q7C36_014327 [Tachysurus vachellii]|uniref:Secreted protein n=1 Tax=Tachysurus vachellii TaxID=175792 RepID=A0AA88SH20_TACVA|nr:hypothetical protein Q7C36_014327 [Tachysurus vachellii]
MPGGELLLMSKVTVKMLFACVTARNEPWTSVRVSCRLAVIHTAVNADPDSCREPIRISRNMGAGINTIHTSTCASVSIPTTPVSKPHSRCSSVRNSKNNRRRSK